MEIGFYWVNYPELAWQIAHWNGEYWSVCGADVKIENVKQVGEYLGKADRVKPTTS